MGKKRITVLHNQTLLDVALQYFGSPEGITQILADNNLSWDYEAKSGDSLLVTTVPINTDVVAYFSATQHNPASYFELPPDSSMIYVDDGYVASNYVEIKYVY